MKTTLFAALLSALTIAQPSPVTAQDLPITNLSAVQKVNYAHAVRSFRAGRFSDAYGRFAQLADAGHVPSAQLALVMYRNGPTLFHSNWSAAPSQQQRWHALFVTSARDHFVGDDRND